MVELKKLAILVPMRGAIDANFMQDFLSCFISVLKKKGDWIPMPIFSEAVPLDRARNELIRSAIDARADYLFFVDADVVFKSDSLDLMLDAIQQPGIDMLTGIYYERAPPYNPVLRREVEFGKMKPIRTYPTDKIFPVDGAGFGCMMMKRSVSDKLYISQKGKPFLFSDECSEDLFFCRRAREAGFKIFAHPLVQCGHIGSTISEWHYWHHKLDEYRDVKELAKFTGETPEVVLEKCDDAAMNVYRAWTEKFGERKREEITDAELDAFYRAVDYRYDLTSYWSANQVMVMQVLANVKPEHKTFLDYGGGIGDYVLSVLDDADDRTGVLYDINDKNREYAIWRARKRGLESRLRVADVDTPITHPHEFKGYDVVFALDMLEHVKDPVHHLGNIREQMARNGVLLAFVAPPQTFQPQHISMVNIENHGFVRTGTFSYVRDDSDKAIEFKARVASLSGAGVSTVAKPG